MQKVKLGQNNGSEAAAKELRSLVLECAVPAELVRYRISNERYSEETLEKIKSLRGINEYLGICGGGDQNIMILSVLQKNNDIAAARLVDSNVAQLDNFRVITALFTASENEKMWQERLHAWQCYGFSSTEIYKKLGHHRKPLPKISRSLEIDLLNVEITDYLCRWNMKEGTYFLYLSNVFGFGEQECDRMLGLIARNSAFLEGTTVMSVETGSIIREGHNTVKTSFFIKNGDGLEKMRRV